MLSLGVWISRSRVRIENYALDGLTGVGPMVEFAFKYIGGLVASSGPTHMVCASVVVGCLNVGEGK